MQIQPGAWGGGNHFGRIMAEYLSSTGVDVSFDLKAPDLDMIILTEPDASLRTSTYTHKEVLRYLIFRNRQCLVIHRINNSSEARDDAAKLYNRFRIEANKVADHTVFISSWLHRIYVESGFADRPHTVIMNGADNRLWKAKRRRPVQDRLKLVTHHWSNNQNKGFDIYRELDDLLGTSPWSEKIAFTYIGKVPDGFAFRNASYLSPMAGSALAEELARHDVYLTASQFEGAGMHHIEGALCGLPLLYRESGGIPEYCHGFGISFKADNFVEKLEEMIATYDKKAALMSEYPFTGERMCKEYADLISDLLGRREEILAKRRPFRQLQLWARSTPLKWFVAS